MSTAEAGTRPGGTVTPSVSGSRMLTADEGASPKRMPVTPATGPMPPIRTSNPPLRLPEGGSTRRGTTAARTAVEPASTSERMARCDGLEGAVQGMGCLSRLLGARGRNNAPGDGSHLAAALALTPRELLCRPEPQP